MTILDTLKRSLGADEAELEREAAEAFRLRMGLDKSPAERLAEYDAIPRTAARRTATSHV